MLSVAGSQSKSSTLAADWPPANTSSIRERASGAVGLCLLLFVSTRDLTDCVLDFRRRLSSISSGIHPWEGLSQVKLSTCFRITLYLLEAGSEFSQFFACFEEVLNYFRKQQWSISDLLSIVLTFRAAKVNKPSRGSLATEETDREHAGGERHCWELRSLWVLGLNGLQRARRAAPQRWCLSWVLKNKKCFYCRGGKASREREQSVQSHGIVMVVCHVKREPWVCPHGWHLGRARQPLGSGQLRPFTSVRQSAHADLWMWWERDGSWVGKSDGVQIVKGCVGHAQKCGLLCQLSKDSYFLCYQLWWR